MGNVTHVDKTFNYKLWQTQKSQIAHSCLYIVHDVRSHWNQLNVAHTYLAYGECNSIQMILKLCKCVKPADIKKCVRSWKCHLNWYIYILCVFRI